MNMFFEEPCLCIHHNAATTFCIANYNLVAMANPLNRSAWIAFARAKPDSLPHLGADGLETRHDDRLPLIRLDPVVDLPEALDIDIRLIIHLERDPVRSDG